MLLKKTQLYFSSSFLFVKNVMAFVFKPSDIRCEIQQISLSLTKCHFNWNPFPIIYCHIFEKYGKHQNMNSSRSCYNNTLSSRSDCWLFTRVLKRYTMCLSALFKNNNLFIQTRKCAAEVKFQCQLRAEPQPPVYSVGIVLLRG